MSTTKEQNTITDRDDFPVESRRHRIVSIPMSVLNMESIITDCGNVVNFFTKVMCNSVNKVLDVNLDTQKVKVEINDRVEDEHELFRDLRDCTKYYKSVTESLKFLRSINEGDFELEIYECSCGHHIGLDYTYLYQVGDIKSKCPSCGTEYEVKGVL